MDCDCVVIAVYLGKVSHSQLVPVCQLSFYVKSGVRSKGCLATSAVLWELLQQLSGPFPGASRASPMALPGSGSQGTVKSYPDLGRAEVSAVGTRPPDHL